MQKKAELEKEVDNLTKEIDSLIAKVQARKADDTKIREQIEERTRQIVLLPNDMAKFRNQSIHKSRRTVNITPILTQRQSTLKPKRKQLEKEQNLPDRSEELFAAVEEKRVNAAKDREEEAAKLTVRNPLNFTDVGIRQRSD